MKTFTMCVAGAMMALPLPVQAADDASQAEAANARTAAINARTAEINAQAALTKAKSDALGLSPAKGETTLGENAGVIESWMLSAETMRVAARSIAQAVPPGASRVLLLTSEEKFDPSAGTILRRQMDAVGRNMADALDQANCSAPEKAAAALAPLLIPAIGAVASLLKTDTQISGFAIDVKERALVNAIAAQPGKDWIVPTEAVDIAPDSQLLNHLDETMQPRAALLACKRAHPADKDVAAVIDAAVSDADTFYAKVMAAGSDGQSPLSRASTAEAVAGAPVLRLSIEKAGGSLLKRANVWTALGAPAVGLTGGLVVSYRFVLPATGSVKASGLIVCRTALTDMRRVQSGTVKANASACTLV